jgi:hypothetical protein
MSDLPCNYLKFHEKSISALNALSREKCLVADKFVMFFSELIKQRPVVRRNVANRPQHHAIAPKSLRRPIPSYPLKTGRDEISGTAELLMLPSLLLPDLQRWARLRSQYLR